MTLRTRACHVSVHHSGLCTTHSSCCREGSRGLDASPAAPSCTLLQPNTDIVWCWGRSQWAWWAGRPNPLRCLQTPASLGCPESPAGAAAGKGFTSTCPMGLGKPNRVPGLSLGGCSCPLPPDGCVSSPCSVWLQPGPVGLLL